MASRHVTGIKTTSCLGHDQSVCTRFACAQPPFGGAPVAIAFAEAQRGARAFGPTAQVTRTVRPVQPFAFWAGVTCHHRGRGIEAGEGSLVRPQQRPTKPFRMWSQSLRALARPGVSRQCFSRAIPAWTASSRCVHATQAVHGKHASLARVFCYSTPRLCCCQWAVHATRSAWYFAISGTTKRAGYSRVGAQVLPLAMRRARLHSAAPRWQIEPCLPVRVCTWLTSGQHRPRCCMCGPWKEP